MADRKGRTVTFKLPRKLNAGLIKTAIEKDLSSKVTVFQDLGSGESLVELSSKSAAESLIEDGFDVDDVHIICHPPHGYVTNVSIMGLRSYIEDCEVEEALSQYGEITSAVIRLKYKAGHDLEGIENGNRLVRMVLAAKSIPYSIRIGGEWCRIIHDNQQPVCTECSEVGHTRKHCPKIECRICKQKGHMSYVCDRNNKQENNKQEANEFPAEDVSASLNEIVAGADLKTSEKPVDLSTTNVKTSMDFQEDQGRKRSCPIESDSDTKIPVRRSRYHPTPNIENARRRGKSTDKKQSAS